MNILCPVIQESCWLLVVAGLNSEGAGSVGLSGIGGGSTGLEILCILLETKGCKFTA